MFAKLQKKLFGVFYLNVLPDITSMVMQRAVHVNQRFMKMSIWKKRE